jgi:2,4-dienoyl-CoA reductase-like NADH-dependent reductase (Old Yellow Enzyme family)/thioredoxin reductase
MTEQFKHLFTPIKIGTMAAPNRITATGHITGLYDPITNLPTPAQIAYWEARAKGGVGIIGTQAYVVHPSFLFGGFVPFRLPEFVSKFKEVVNILHSYGSVVTLQLDHMGGTAPIMPDPVPAWSASSVASPMSWQRPHPMEVEEIRDVVESYGYAAAKTREAGLDGVEIHCGHGYLPQQFLSPLYNQRQDDYGGTLENRCRFILELIDAVRRDVGTDYTVGLRISGSEFWEGGYDIEYMKKVASILARTGKIDYINVSMGISQTWRVTVPSMYFPPGFAVYLAAAIKEIVDLPIFCIGRINDPVLAEKILADNMADVIGMTRATVCDPEMPRKAKEGRLDEIRHCIGCCDCFQRGNDEGGFGMICALNPVSARELRWGKLEPAKVKKRVVVVGGGPAGLETAKVARERGHEVILLEKSAELGGQTLIAAKAPGREDLAEPARYYTYQMKLLGVDVRLRTEATPQLIKELNPDAIVLATGSLPAKPSLAGVDQPNVVDCRDVLLDKVEVGQHVVVVAGEQHMQSLTCADFLASRGKEVQLINEELHPGMKAESGTVRTVLQRLYTNGVIISPSTALRAIEKDTVVTYNVLTGVERRIPNIDTVVLCYGGVPDMSLYHTLKSSWNKELHQVGDCVSPSRIQNATYYGARVGRLL